MIMLLHVHFLPAHVAPESLVGVVVVIDQLRASSTIVAALAAGAAHIVPCPTTEDALNVRRRLGPDVLLGGERFGKRIDGFDLANSPSEYTHSVVKGRTIAFTTTNGTVALLHARLAAHVVVGCLNNQDAVAGAAVKLAAHARCDLHLLCAGTGGAACLDDVIAAGAIAHVLDQFGEVTMTDTARIAISAFRDALLTGMEAAMAGATGGRNLIEIGMAHDVAECSRLNTRPIVPHFNPNSRDISLADGLGPRHPA